MPSSPRTSVHRWLGGLYLVGLHALLLALLVEPGLVQRARRYLAHDPSVTAEYQAMVRAQAAISESLPGDAFVFLGDSRVRDLPVREAVPGPAGAAINFGIGGDTTKGVLARLPRYDRLGTARRIVVSVGVNDLSHQPDEVVLGNYRELLRELAAIGPGVVVVAILPINERMYRQANATLLSGQKVTNDRIRGVNEAVRRLCAAHPNVGFVDPGGAVSLPDGNLRDDYTVDGLHLNQAGNAAWATALRGRPELG